LAIVFAEKGNPKAATGEIDRAKEKAKVAYGPGVMAKVMATAVMVRV
jgi:hypothetical protein